MDNQITPGKMLLEAYLKPMGISQNAMARAIGVAPRAINEIIHARRSITPAMSIRRRLLRAIRPILARHPGRVRLPPTGGQKTTAHSRHSAGVNPCIDAAITAHGRMLQRGGKDGKAMEVRVESWGDSLALRIPSALAAKVGLKLGSTVDVMSRRRRAGGFRRKPAPQSPGNTCGRDYREQQARRSGLWSAGGVVK